MFGAPRSIHLIVSGVTDSSRVALISHSEQDTRFLFHRPLAFRAKFAVWDGSLRGMRTAIGIETMSS